MPLVAAAAMEATACICHRGFQFIYLSVLHPPPPLQSALSRLSHIMQCISHGLNLALTILLDVYNNILELMKNDPRVPNALLEWSKVVSWVDFHMISYYFLRIDTFRITLTVFELLSYQNSVSDLQNSNTADRQKLMTLLLV